MEDKSAELAQRFGRRIRTLRKTRGLTQEQLGRATGLDYKHIGAIERGGKQSSFTAVAKIAVALDVDVHELFLPESQIGDDVRADVERLVADPRRIDAARLTEFLKALRAALRRLERPG